MIHFISRQFYALKILLTGLFALGGKSLNKVVEKTDKAHFGSNATIAAYKHGWFRSIVKSVHFYPFRAIILVFCFYLLIAAAFFILLKPFYPHTDKDLNDTLVNAVIGLLSAQAALVAIVYPLVIALVGILFDIRSTNGSRFSVLLHETEALPTGISALLLCAVFAIELVIIPNLLTASILSLTILNSIWFVFNIFAFGFFLTHVFKYIHPRTRCDMLYCYIVNVTWPTQRRKIIVQDQLSNAISYGYIAANYQQAATKTEINIIEDALTADELDDAVTIYLRRTRNLADLKFAVLNVVANSWLAQAAQHIPATKPVLTFSGNISYKNAVILASSHLQSFNWAQKILVKAAYSFCSSIPQSSPPAVFELLNEQTSELIFLVESDRFQAFQNQLEQVIDFHIFIFKITEAVIGNKKISYTQMLYPFDNHITRYTVGEKWSSVYHDLFKRVVNTLPKETEFFTHCAYLSHKLYKKALPFASPGALESINDIAFSLFLRLSKWGFLTYKSETGISGNPGILFELTPQKNEIYAAAWRDFVGGWEALLAAVPFAVLTASAKNDEEKWSDLINHYQFLQQHLFNTANIVLFSVWHGDSLAIDWAADVLTRWDDIVSKKQLAKNFEQNIAGQFFTDSLLKQSWLDVKTDLLAQYPAITAEIVLAQIIKNLWLDTQIMTIFLLTSWVRQYKNNGAAAAAINNILKQTLLDQGNSKCTIPLTFPDLFISTLRLYSDENYLANFYDLTIDQKRLDQSVITGRQYAANHYHHSVKQSLYINTAIVLIALAPDDMMTFSAEMQNLLTYMPGNRKDLVNNLHHVMTEISLLDSAITELLPVFHAEKTYDIAQKKLNLTTFISRCIEKLN